jgi:hypothetical protein
VGEAFQFLDSAPFPPVPWLRQAELTAPFTTRSFLEAA